MPSLEPCTLPTVYPCLPAWLQQHQFDGARCVECTGIEDSTTCGSGSGGGSGGAGGSSGGSSGGGDVQSNYVPPTSATDQLQPTSIQDGRVIDGPWIVGLDAST